MDDCGTRIAWENIGSLSLSNIIMNYLLGTDGLD